MAVLCILQHEPVIQGVKSNNRSTRGIAITALNPYIKSHTIFITRTSCIIHAFHVHTQYVFIILSICSIAFEYLCSTTRPQLKTRTCPGVEIKCGTMSNTLLLCLSSALSCLFFIIL